MRTLLVLLAVAAADSFVVTGVRMPVMRSALTEYRTEAPKAIIGWTLMTSVKVVQHAAGIGSPTLKGAGLLSFVKYDNRGISVAITAALLATIIQGFVNTYGSSF